MDEPIVNDILGRLTRDETVNAYPARLRAKDGSVKYVMINERVPREGRHVRPHALLHDRDRGEGLEGAGTNGIRRDITIPHRHGLEALDLGPVLQHLPAEERWPNACRLAWAHTSSRECPMPRLSRIFWAAGAALALAGCDDHPTEPKSALTQPVGGTSPADPSATTGSRVVSSVAWNGTARGLLTAQVANPIVQVRVLTYLSLAQYNAIIAAENSRPRDRIRRPQVLPRVHPWSY